MFATDFFRAIIAREPLSFSRELNLLNLDFALVQTSHSSIFAIEKFCNFLESWPLGFDEEKPDTQDFDDQDDNIYKLKLPLQMLQADRVDVSGMVSKLAH